MNKYNIKYTTLSIILLLFCLKISGQTKRSNNWYFGYYAGVSFNNNTVKALEDGLLNTREGCATISDENSNLMFYTDGVTVWNKKHSPMPNGTGLFGSETSTQSSIIVPYPGKNSLYYIFTVDGPNAANISNNFYGLRYSIVDMSLNTQLGDVIIDSKNTPLFKYSTEKLTAVTHANLRDIWVIAHEWVTNAFYAFLVTPNGINVTAVISNVGTIHGIVGNTDFKNIPSGTGYLKVSPDGKKLALAIFGLNTVEILNFDNSTGIVSEPLMTDNFTNPYGVEFSPDGTKVYFGTTHNTDIYNIDNYIFQYDLSANNIVSSKILIATVPSAFNNHHLGALQLAPDGKIYIARYNETYLAVITNPNALGVDCGFINDAFSLGTGSSLFGLPNFIQSSIVEDDTIKIICDNFDFYFPDTICAGEKVYYEPYSFSCSAQPHYVWRFGDGGVETTNSAHTFYDTGTYNVTLTVEQEGELESNKITKQIEVRECPEFDCARQEISDY